MKEYKSEFLRNVALVSHGGAGKTSIAEAILFNTGANSRQGKVDDGSSLLDFEDEEKRRKMTISTSIAPVEWQECKINVLDTPGFADFIGDVCGAMRAADGVVVTVCAASGVEVSTEKVWQLAAEQNLPRIVFVNKMDRENADFNKVLEQLKSTFGGVFAPVVLPIGSESSFKGIVDLIDRKAFVRENAAAGFVEASPIPDYMADDVELARTMLIEAAAEGDDDLMMKYLEGEGQEFSHEEITKGLLNAVRLAKATLVICGSAARNIGIQTLLDAIVKYIPAPSTRVLPCTKFGGTELVERKASDPFAALVFKTTADPHIGRMSYVRVFSGTLKSDMQIFNASKNKMEKIGALSTLIGKKVEPMTVANAGDIIVIPKMNDVATANTLCDKTTAIVFPDIVYPKPMFMRSVEPRKKGDEDKIGNAISRIKDEDPTFKTYKDAETNQLIAQGMGEQHLTMLTSRMLAKFGADILLKDPRVAYRETIRKSVQVEGKHKKQSGGRGQYGHVWLRLEPLALGAGVEFDEEIFGGSVPNNYIPAVEKGARKKLLEGIIAGYPMVDVKVVLYDGSYHDVDSSELAFVLATSIALKKGVPTAGPVLLEPVHNVEIFVPERYAGDVMGDLSNKRGRPMGMEAVGNGITCVKAEAPLAEMFRYSIDLRSMTQGRGWFNMEFAHYEEVPRSIADGIIAEYQKTKQHDEE